MPRLNRILAICLPVALVAGLAGLPLHRGVPAATAAPASFRPSLSFEANLGQAPRDVRFQARAAAYLAAFSPAEATLTFSGGGRARGAAPRLRLKFVGARPGARIEGLEPRVTRSHYCHDPDPARWVTDVPHYGRIRYAQVYPGIDLVFYGEPDDLEYDFIVAPGAKPETIRVAFEGARKIRLDERGDLLLDTAAGTLRQARPRIYQEVEGTRRAIEGGYVRRGARTIGFEVGRYDRDRPLVIDPSLIYSSYHGYLYGTDTASGVTVDREGNFYVIGQNDVDHIRYAYVTKFNPDGEVLYWTSTPWSIVHISSRKVAVDAAGAAYFVGSMDTESAANPFGQPRRGHDAIVIRLDPSGRLTYATFLGGSGSDSASDIEIVPDGTIYVAGSTTSPNFPGAVNALAGATDAFLAILAPDGSVRSSILVGGSSVDSAGSLVRLDESSVALVGTTESADFPIRQEGAAPVPQASYGGGRDLFIAVLRDGEIVRSTFWGGSGTEFVGDAALVPGPAPAIAVTGWTNSTDFPVVLPVQSDALAMPPPFLMKLIHGPQMDRVAFSTFLYESGGGVAADASGAIYFTGPNTFAGKLAPTGRIEYLFHGIGGSSIAVNEAGRIAIAGYALATLPTFRAPRPYRDLYVGSFVAGTGDGFVALLAEGPNPDATSEQDDPDVTYAGTWATVASSRLRHSGGLVAVSDEAGAQAVIRFTGTGIQVLGLRGPRSGFLRVSLVDDALGTTPWPVGMEYRDRRVDTFATIEEARSLLLSIEGLPAGKTYRLTITVDGTKNERSLGHEVGIDGFNVLGAP